MWPAYGKVETLLSLHKKEEHTKKTPIPIDFFTDDEKSWYPFWMRNKELKDITYESCHLRKHVYNGKNTQWKEHIKYFNDVIMRPYEYVKNERPYVVLKKGTILYHSSRFVNPINDTKKAFVSAITRQNKKDPVMFFGLDSHISIWYAAELTSKTDISDYYLNKYILTEDLEVFHNKWEIGEEQTDNTEAEASIHLQFGYHIDVDSIGELCTEVLIPTSLLSKLKLQSVFEIDIAKLLENSVNESFDVVTTLKKYESKTSKTSKTQDVITAIDNYNIKRTHYDNKNGCFPEKY